MTKKLLLLLITIPLLMACSHKRATETELLQIERRDGYSLITVRDPWNTGGVLHRYALVDRDKPMPDNLPEATLVKVPLQSAVVCSDVYARPIKELGCVNAVKGVMDAQYFKTPEIIAGLKNGSVTDCGSSMAPSIERIVSISPEAIFLSPFENSGYGALANTGIPIIEMADYMEASPLARARWIEFLGLLFGKDQQAVTVYNHVANDYSALRSAVANPKHRPVVLSEYPVNGVWYVPGGKSYKARLYADAGADYPWTDETSSGSLPMDFASVLNKAQHADIWLVTVYGMDLDKKTFAELYPNNSRFRAFNSHGVYYVDSAKSGIFEETAFHPELLLKEYVKIFHPEMLPDYQLRYYKPITD